MSNPEIEETPKDDLEKDLRELISKSRVNGRVGAHRENDLLQNLIIFIVDRDGKVLKHGINVGKESIEKRT